MSGNKDLPANSRYKKLSGRPGFLIRRLHQIHVSNFLRETQGLNITPIQYGVLNVLEQSTTALDQGTLGAQLGIDRTNVADVVIRLKNRGLVTRVTNPADRRGKLVSLTKSGREMVELVGPAMVATQKKLVEPLSVAERETMMVILQKLLAAHNETARTIYEVLPSDKGD